MARSKLARRYRQNKADARRSLLRSNPPLFTDIVVFIGPSFGAYAGARLLAKGATAMVTKAAPRFGKYAAAGAGVGTFLAAWFLAHRWKPLAKYHTPIVVGAGIAALQTLIQSFLPRVGNLLNLTAPPATVAPGPEAAGALTDDGNLYGTGRDFFTYNDMFDPGRYAGQANQPPDVPGSPAEQARVGEQLDTLSDLMEEMGADSLSGLGGDAGIFTN